MRREVVNFRAEPMLLRALALAAQREGQTRSEIIREAPREKVGVQ